MKICNSRCKCLYLVRESDAKYVIIVGFEISPPFTNFTTIIMFILRNYGVRQITETTVYFSSTAKVCIRLKKLFGVSSKGPN